MTRTKCRTEQPPMVLRTRPALEMDDKQLFEFCRINREWRIERNAEGELEDPQNVSSDPILPGFVQDLRPIWEPGF
jgi:hypothetical protein